MNISLAIWPDYRSIRCMRDNKILCPYPQLGSFMNLKALCYFLYCLSLIRTLDFGLLSNFSNFFILMLILKNIDVNFLFEIVKPKLIFVRIKRFYSINCIKFWQINNFIFLVPNSYFLITNCDILCRSGNLFSYW